MNRIILSIIFSLSFLSHKYLSSFCCFCHGCIQERQLIRRVQRVILTRWLNQEIMPKIKGKALCISLANESKKEVLPIPQISHLDSLWFCHLIFNYGFFYQFFIRISCRLSQSLILQLSLFADFYWYKICSNWWILLQFAYVLLWSHNRVSGI